MENIKNREHWMTRIIVVVAFVLSQLIDQFDVPSWLQGHTEILNQVADICAQLTGSGG